MKIASWAWVLIVFPAAVASAQAADDPSIERMATCQDSWLDWNKTDPARLKTFGDRFRADFSRRANDPFFVPRTETTVAGLRVLQAFPDSVGMGVGFSITVEATFDKTRESVSGILGKPLEKCETGDGMRMCELEIGEKRTFTLMAKDDPKNATTLLGCYYYYEK